MISSKMIARIVRSVQRRKWLDSGDTVYGYSVLGAGCARVAIDLRDGFILKVQYWADSNQTRREIRFFQDMPGAHPYIVPIVAHDELKYQWSVMPKAEDVGEAKWNEVEELGKKLTPFGLCDFKAQNSGWYEGTLRAVDYGI